MVPPRAAKEGLGKRATLAVIGLQPAQTNDRSLRVMGNEDPYDRHSLLVLPVLVIGHEVLALVDSGA